jgi:GT2 family glycosyltransferase
LKTPQIDIIVPTYNRPDDIKRFIKEVLNQNYPNFSVYIIDDHGEDDLDWVSRVDHRIKFFRLNKNLGQSAARNFAIEKSEAEIIVSLDDDAWFFDDPDSLRKIVDYFQYDSTIGCVMFDVLEPNTVWLSKQRNIKDKEEIGSHITCGCAYRKSSLMKIGGFSNFFHSGAEETDISLKLINSGSKLIFGEKIKVFHNYNGGERSREWYNKVRHNTTRNDLLIVIMYYPLLLKIPFLLGKYFSHIKFSVFNKRSNTIDQLTATLYTIKSIFSFFKAMPIALKNTNSMKFSTFQKWYKIKW